MPLDPIWPASSQPIEEILQDARAGRMFILVDHEDRENEGDLVIPAAFATAEAINFMALHGRGLICLALTPDRVDELGLKLMTSNNASRHETAFTVSIEAREGISTGISAHDRARTVAVAIDPATTGADLASPGHVFPLRACETGGTAPTVVRDYGVGAQILAALGVREIDLLTKGAGVRPVALDGYDLSIRQVRQIT